MKPYFPIALDVEGKACLVIGGDAEAEDKARKLLDARAKVTVVSPRFYVEGLKELAHARKIRWRKGYFEPKDLRGQFLVMLCVKTDSQLTRDVFQLCGKARILLCSYDQPQYCDFTMPAIVRSGRLCVAISTGGASPALARRIRQDLEKLFDGKVARFLDRLAKVRKRLERTQPNVEKRREKLKGLVKDFKISGKIKIPAVR